MQTTGEENEAEKQAKIKKDNVKDLAEGRRKIRGRGKKHTHKL